MEDVHENVSICNIAMESNGSKSTNGENDDSIESEGLKWLSNLFSNDCMNSINSDKENEEKQEISVLTKKKADRDNTQSGKKRKRSAFENWSTRDKWYLQDFRLTESNDKTKDKDKDKNKNKNIDKTKNDEMVLMREQLCLNKRRKKQKMMNDKCNEKLQMKMSKKGKKIENGNKKGKSKSQLKSRFENTNSMEIENGLRDGETIRLMSRINNLLDGRNKQLMNDIENRNIFQDTINMIHEKYLSKQDETFPDTLSKCYDWINALFLENLRLQKELKNSQIEMEIIEFINLENELKYDLLSQFVENENENMWNKFNQLYQKRVGEWNFHDLVSNVGKQVIKKHKKLKDKNENIENKQQLKQEDKQKKHSNDKMEMDQDSEVNDKINIKVEKYENSNNENSINENDLNMNDEQEKIDYQLNKLAVYNSISQKLQEYKKLYQRLNEKKASLCQFDNDLKNGLLKDSGFKFYREMINRASENAVNELWSFVEKGEMAQKELSNILSDMDEIDQEFKHQENKYFGHELFHRTYFYHHPHAHGHPYNHPGFGYMQYSQYHHPSHLGHLRPGPHSHPHPYSHFHQPRGNLQAVNPAITAQVQSQPQRQGQAQGHKNQQAPKSNKINHKSHNNQKGPFFVTQQNTKQQQQQQTQHQQYQLATKSNMSNTSNMRQQLQIPQKLQRSQSDRKAPKNKTHSNSNLSIPNFKRTASTQGTNTINTRDSATAIPAVPAAASATAAQIQPRIANGKSLQNAARYRAVLISPIETLVQGIRDLNLRSDSVATFLHYVGEWEKHVEWDMEQLKQWYFKILPSSIQIAKQIAQQIEAASSKRVSFGTLPAPPQPDTYSGANVVAAGVAIKPKTPMSHLQLNKGVKTIDQYHQLQFQNKFGNSSSSQSSQSSQSRGQLNGQLNGQLSGQSRSQVQTQAVKAGSKNMFTSIGGPKMGPVEELNKILGISSNDNRTSKVVPRTRKQSIRRPVSNQSRQSNQPNQPNQSAHYQHGQQAIPTQILASNHNRVSLNVQRPRRTQQRNDVNQGNPGNQHLQSHFSSRSRGPLHNHSQLQESSSLLREIQCPKPMYGDSLFLNNVRYYLDKMKSNSDLLKKDAVIRILLQLNVADGQRQVLENFVDFDVMSKKFEEKQYSTKWDIMNDIALYFDIATVLASKTSNNGNKIEEKYKGELCFSVDFWLNHIIPQVSFWSYKEFVAWLNHQHLKKLGEYCQSNQITSAMFNDAVIHGNLQKRPEIVKLFDVFKGDPQLEKAKQKFITVTQQKNKRCLVNSNYLNLTTR